MMTVRRQLGKLAEVVFGPPMSIDDLSAFVAEVRSLVQHAPEPLVFVCDWRAIDRFDQAMADTIVWTMRRDNPGVRANGVLVSARNTALYEQVTHVLHEAKKPERRVFRARSDLAAFLDPFLTADEQRRRETFLDENHGKASASRTVTT